MIEKLPRWRRKMLRLLGRAAMSELELDSGVIRATPVIDDFRMSIASTHIPEWSDCVSIGFRLPTDDPGVWHVGHFSPARCRLIALQLLHRAKVIEKREGATQIDKPRNTEYVPPEGFVVSVSETVIEVEDVL